MDIYEKLKILSAAAKYDVSCSSSGSSKKSSSGIGSTDPSGICHSFTPDGRCISLLKILLTNYCMYDCAYCINRSSNDVERAAFTPDEVIDLTMNFYRRNFIEGLFLSSAVFKNPNYTMELLLETAKKLRLEHHFNGYIHLKAIPGADPKLIESAGMFADRMSVNIELPSSESLKLLAPQKSKEKIIRPMSFISNHIIQNIDDRKRYKSSPKFVPGGQSTQLIVGATSDSDFKILNLTQNLYDKFKLKRVYYSAYVPVSFDPKLPQIKNPPTLREHRLYQADWLLRFYGFRADELLNSSNPNFNVTFDPKTDWALKNIHKFPVEINTISYDMLLRVPGIGIRSAQKIYSVRKVHTLNFEDLKKLGLVMKRAKYFITCNGKYYGDTPFKENLIEEKLTPKISENSININDSFEQLNLFSQIDRNDKLSALTGEL